MSLVQAFHNIFVDKYCLMYTEETASCRKEMLSSGRMEWLKEEKVLWNGNTIYVFSVYQNIKLS